MNNKVNYTFVGIVVLAVLTLIFMFIIWMIRPNSLENFTKYYIYFNESVAGLNVNSPVKYKGVNVGKVLSIKINPKNYNEIQVLVQLAQDTPINESTRATLNIQGVTGLVFINLSLGNKNTPSLKKNKDKIMTIKTAPSLFNRVEKSLGGLTARLSDSLDSLNKLLNPTNLKNLAITLNQAKQFMSKMNNVLNNKTINNFHTALKNINKILPKINILVDKSGNFTDKASISIQKIVKSYKSMESSIFAFKTALKNGEFNFKQISQNTLKNINISLSNFNNSLLRLNNVIQQYQNNPNALLFERKKQKKGPGEK